LISNDKSGEILASTVKFAARIAATAAGVPPVPGVGAAGGTKLRDLLNAIEGPGALTNLYNRWSQADSSFDFALKDMRAAEEAMAKATTEQETKKAADMMTRAKDAVKMYDDLRSKARTELLAEYEAFKTRQRLGAVEEKRAFSYMIDLAESKTAGARDFPRDTAGVDAWLADLPSLSRMWKDVGVVVTAVPAGGNAVKATDRRLFIPRGSDTSKTPIYYRTPQPMIVSVWVKDVRLEATVVESKGDPVARQPGIRLASQSVLDVRDAAVPPRFVAFDEKAFSTQNIDIGFDDRGNLITFKRTGTSNVAALTKALADAAETAPGQFQAGTTALGSAVAERDKQAAAIAGERTKAIQAETAQLNAEILLIEARKKHKEALDAANASGTTRPQ
jgi:hypothetical protein